MARTPKMQAAWEALERLSNASPKSRKKFTVKAREARKAEARLYAEARKLLKATGLYEPLTCVCKVDKVVLTTSKIGFGAFATIPGFRCSSPEDLPQSNPYKKIDRIHGAGSIEQVTVTHGRKAHWLAPHVIKIFPRDKSGLLESDLRLILELLPDFKFQAIEIAFDFPIDSVMDVDRVRRHFLSGKSRLHQDSHNRLHQRWGSSNSSKVIKIYVKPEIQSLRIELELRPRFLKLHEIKDIFDFHRLAGILIPQHIFFGQLDLQKLVARLNRSGFSRDRQKRILEQIADRKTSLWETLTYLSNKVKLTNVRARLFKPLKKTNSVIKTAAATWAAQWPSRPRKLGRKP